MEEVKGTKVEMVKANCPECGYPCCLEVFHLGTNETCEWCGLVYYVTLDSLD